MGCQKIIYKPELSKYSSKKLKARNEMYIYKYRFAFNGQEKDDEVAGEGNINTALFWEYDTRLGIRWNMDPVTKPWQSRYTCFSDNPICKVDPNGDDDYFNSDGTYSHSKGSGKTIFILMSDKQTKTLSQVQFITSKDGDGTPGSNKVISNIVTHYHKSTSNFCVRKDNTCYAEWIPGTSRINISLNSGGSIDKLLEHSGNLKSILVHEEKHRALGHKTTKKEHLNVYFHQFDDASFASTTAEFRKEMFKNASQLIEDINWKATGHTMYKHTPEVAKLQKKLDAYKKKYEVK